MGVEMTLLRLLAFRPAPLPGAEGDAPEEVGAVAPRSGRRSELGHQAVEDVAALEPQSPQPADAEAEPDPVTDRRAPAVATVREPEPPPAVPAPEPPSAGTAQSPLPQGAASSASSSAGHFDWHRFAEGLPPGTVRELALHAELREHDGERVAIAVAPGTLCTGRTRARLKDALEETLGCSLRLEIVDQSRASETTPAARLAAVAAERQAEAEATMRGDPVVQALAEEFGAKLGAVRILEDTGAGDDAAAR
jgi:DNA polymerase-3 subunit gamma/tau